MRDQRPQTTDQRPRTKSIWSLYALFLCFVLTTACSGGEEKKSDNGPFPEGEIVDPSIAADPASDLSSLAVNTFRSGGIEILTDPEWLEFGPAQQDVKETKTFRLINNTSDEHKLTIAFFGVSGGFRLLEGDSGVTAYKPDITLLAGASQEFSVEFDASLMGVSNGYIEITASDTQGMIHLPLRGVVAGAGDYKIIPAANVCSDDDGPIADKIDFGRVASGTAQAKSIKICNTGGKPITFNSVVINPNTSGAISEDLLPNPFTAFEWEIEDTLNTAYFQYYNPPETEAFAETESQPFPGPFPDPTEAYNFRVHGTPRTIEGLVVAPGSFVQLDVFFSPSLAVEPPDGVRFEPVSIASDMVINTTAGENIVDLLGGTAGREPALQVTFTQEDDEIIYEVDLNSNASAILFGKAKIFTDWITEDTRDVTITLKNIGSGGNPLKIWFDPINRGYFTFVRRNVEKPYPLLINSGQAKTIKMRYAPTPTEVGTSYDFGQAILHHNGANGPHHGLTLIGEQEGGHQAVEILQGGGELKYEYPADRPRNFCAFKIGEGTPVTFTINNHSTLPGNNLVSTFTFDSLVGVTAAPPSTTQTTQPGQTSLVTVLFTPTVVAGEGISGRILINNTYALQSQYGTSPRSYVINFEATSSEDGVCSGGGLPINARATLVFDRITMILPSLTESTRNHPAFKFHLPIDLNTETRRARVNGLEYNSSPDVPPVNQIRSYAHQFTNPVGGQYCFSLPTNPYRLEFEEGSWDGPFQCNYNSGGFNVIGSAACMANNGAATFTDTAGSLGTPNATYQVFYHEFVKFDTEEECRNGTPAFFGKIASFSRQLTPNEESIRSVFGRMEADPNGNEAFYEGITHPYQFDSYITFAKDFTCTNSAAVSTTHSAGTTLRAQLGDAEAIKACWYSLSGNDSMKRVLGMIDECSYFQFTIESGCIPGEPGCESSLPDYEHRDTWKGYGEYQPVVVNEATGEEDETKWDLTLRNVHIQAFVLSNGGQNGFFNHAGHLLFSDLYVTLTTKAVGEDPSNPDWDDLIAVESRSDFVRTRDVDQVFIRRQGGTYNTKQFWTDDGLNSEFTAGGDDDVDCFADPDQRVPIALNRSCRGNYRLTADGSSIMHAGEPIDFVNGNRTMLAGLASFQGKGNTAPGFAAESAQTGVGPPLYFTFHGCFKEGENLDPRIGCYDPHLDDENIMREYREHGLLSDSDLLPDDGDPTNGESKALINYIIFNEDRKRLTDYFNAPGNYFFDDPLNPSDQNYYGAGRPCGYGM